jgi:hypothetical protein
MYKYLVSIEDNAAPFKEEQTRYERVCIWFLWYLFGHRRSREVALRMAKRSSNVRKCSHADQKD